MSLTPLSRPFPAPPYPSHSNSTASSWIHPETTSATSLRTSGTPSHSTGRSDSLSSLATSASFPHSPPIQVNLPSPADSEPFDFGAIGHAPTKRVRQFGEGWMSTSSDVSAEKRGNGGLEVHIDSAPQTPPMTSSFLDDASNITPVAPRIRNSSLPILPGPGILRNSLGLDDGAYMPDLDSLTLSEGQSYFEYPQSHANSPSPYHTHDLFSPHRPQLDPRYIPKLAPKTPVLTHHQSVPNLDRSQRRRGSVRFSDELLYDDDEEEVLPPRQRMGMGQRSMPTPAEVKRRNVYIHSLPSHIPEHILRSYAEGFGKVVSMRVAVEEGKGLLDRYESRRHAFVMFDTNDQASAFMLAIRAKGLPCEYAKEDWQTEYKAREDRTSSNIYVVGLPLEWSKDEVEDYMTQFGRVASLRLLEDKDGNRRGPVLIRFDSRPQAERAIKILNGQTHPTTGERIQARIADSDGQKDYKKLRTSTSADLLLDDRAVPPIDDASDVETLSRIRDKYARRLQLLEAQITAAASPSTPHSYQPTHHYTSPAFHHAHTHNLPTPPHSAFALPSPAYSAGTPPQQQAWRHRQLSSSNPYSPWVEGSPSYHHPQPPAEFTFAPYAFGSPAEQLSSNAPSWTPSQRQSFSYRPPSTHLESGLHHARSTPELGRGQASDSAAKLLWPN